MPISIPYTRVSPSPVPNQDAMYATERQVYTLDERGVIKALLGLIARQGGSATSWATVGTTSYPLAAMGLQLGAAQWTGEAADSGGLTVTYPTAYVGHPIVFAIAINDTSNYVSCTTDSNGGVSTFQIYWHTTDGGTKTSIDFGWIAVGPI